MAQSAQLPTLQRLFPNRNETTARYRKKHYQLFLHLVPSFSLRKEIYSCDRSQACSLPLFFPRSVKQETTLCSLNNVFYTIFNHLIGIWVSFTRLISQKNFFFFKNNFEKQTWPFKNFSKRKPRQFSNTSLNQLK